MKKTDKVAKFKFKYNSVVFLVLLGALLVLIGVYVGKSGFKKNESTQEEIVFEKDEYCRRTYAESYVKNYEKKLIGYRGNESETIKLVEMFFSPRENQCVAVYDYNYINPTIYEGPNGEKNSLSMFERRVTFAISPDNVIDTFELTIGGSLKDFTVRSKYEELMRELKSRK